MSPDSLLVTGKRKREGYRSDVGCGCDKNIAAFALALELRISDWQFQRDQFIRFGYYWQVTQHNAIHLAERARGNADAHA